MSKTPGAVEEACGGAIHEALWSKGNDAVRRYTHLYPLSPLYPEFHSYNKIFKKPPVDKTFYMSILHRTPGSPLIILESMHSFAIRFLFQDLPSLNKGALTERYDQTHRLLHSSFADTLRAISADDRGLDSSVRSRYAISSKASILFKSTLPNCSLFHFLFQGFNLQPKDVACFPLKEKEKPPRSYFLYKTYILQPHLFKLERGWPFLYTSPLTPLLFLCAAFLLLYDLQNSTNFLLSFLYTYSTIDHVRSLPLISFLC